ncbi:MAG: glycosyltransferase, partial [Desulfobacteraceae bacterium]
KDYVDELIIVDTGSTDSTVDIAKKYTDKIYFHPWENSFSKARNQALSYATGDWVFQIDGDEELMEGSGELLRKTVQEAVNEDVINVKLLCSYSDGAKTSMHYFERIFRNNGIIHYEGRVHNRIVGYKSPRYSRIELWHYGYDVEEDKAQQKFERTTGLLKKDIEDDPQNPLPHHYLSSSYLSKNMFKEALKEAELAIQLTERLENRDHIYAWTYYNASMSLFRLGEHEKAIEYSLRALRIYPDNLDSYYMLTIITGEKTEWEAVCKYGENYIRVWRELKDNPEKAEMSINTTISEAPAIYMLLGHAHHADKAYREMDECYSRACDTANEKWQVFWNIGAYHLDKSGDMDLAEKYLNLSKLEAPDEHNVWYMLAKYHNKCGNKNDEISTLEKVIEIGTEEDFIYNRLLTLYAEKEMNDKALFLLSSMEKIDISLYSHLLKLGNSYIETGNLELAFQCYTKAAESKPNSPEAWSILSEITYSLGKFEDSKVFAEKALEFNENDLSNLLTMCDLTLKLGDIESHINYCDKILDNLNLNRSRTLEGFNDLKEVFIEINDSTGNINSLKINSIINQLDSYISPSA